ncbi:MAG TPA: FAD:protein FMN transferase [Candidatus Saccharimonadales bacterium]|nr:FAD:protein FMN transferase [Candidatus Saccharimonadales bacterium]
MPVTDPNSDPVPTQEPSRGLTRRRFLASVGLLAGAGALAPLLSRTRLGGIESLDVTRPALGTWVRILVRHLDPARAQRAVDRAFAAIARVDAQMSVHRADSQLTRVNRLAGEAPAQVDLALLDMLGISLAAARHTDGLYDPTILPLMRLYGFYDSGASRYPSDREIAAVEERVGWRHVTLDRARRTVGLARPGMGLDLGSGGKGWAIDRAVEALRAEGVTSALVDAGGNVYGLGAPEPGAPGWTVGVYHPVTRQAARAFVLRDAAVATSANYEQYRILGGRRVGHLFDARRGVPADGHLSASVVARTGVESDVMSLPAFLLGPDRFQWPGALETCFLG